MEEVKKFVGICVRTDYARRKNFDFCMMLPYPIECASGGFIPDGVIRLARDIISHTHGSNIIFKGIYTRSVELGSLDTDVVNVSICGKTSCYRVAGIFENLFKYLYV